MVHLVVALVREYSGHSALKVPSEKGARTRLARTSVLADSPANPVEVGFEKERPMTQRGRVDVSRLYRSSAGASVYVIARYGCRPKPTQMTTLGTTSLFSPRTVSNFVNFYSLFYNLHGTGGSCNFPNWRAG